jgi:sugar phosphate permease
MAIFMAAQPISNILGSPISAALLGINWLGLAGWRWLFILEGIPAVVLGFVTLFYLTDWPHQAGWLRPEEREFITAELEYERAGRRAAHSQNVWRAVMQKPIILLSIALFCTVSSVYGFNLWLPTVLKRLSGFSNARVSVISALPYCVGLGAMLITGWSSDRTKERRWHTAGCLTLIAIGLSLSVVQKGVALPMVMFCIAAIGMYGYLPSFWSIPTGFLSGTAAAASIGLINSVGNLGGFVGPYIVGYLSKKTHSFVAGIIFLSLCGAVAAGIIVSLRPPQAHAAAGEEVRI